MRATENQYSRRERREKPSRHAEGLDHFALPHDALAVAAADGTLHRGSAKFLLERNPSPSEHEIRRAIQGNICRCTGYVNIVKSIQGAGKAIQALASGQAS